MSVDFPFARIIPLLKTPIGVDAFDYRIPPTLTVAVGDLVVIPFRRQHIVGLVQRLITESAYSEKAASILHLYGAVRFPPSFISLLQWTAERTYTSQPTVLHAWLRTLPKRPSVVAQTQTFPTRRARHIETHWTTTPQRDLLDRARALQQEGKRVLILTPWKTRAERLHQDLLGSLLLSSDQNMGDYHRTWGTFTAESHSMLIATRIGAWLMPFADQVLLDEPENDDHKQDDLSPRYDVRKIAAWMATTQDMPLETFGITPALHVSVPAPTITTALHTFMRHPGGHTAIPCLQADTLFALEEYEGPLTIIHPIRGLLAHLTCRDCGWQPVCTICGYPAALDVAGAVCRLCHKPVAVPMNCPTCGNVDLGKSFPGIERVKQAWIEQNPEKVVEWRDLSNEQMDAPFQKKSFVLITLPSLLGGAVEDIRRHERQCVALRRLAARVAEAEGVLGLQGEEEELTRWITWLTTAGVDVLFTEERDARRLFRYPPSVRRIKLLIDKEPAEAEAWQTKAAQTLPAHFQWEGPFSAAYGTPGQRRRLIWHIIVPPDVSEASLLPLLTPFAKVAKIDLDPIAFFR